MELLKQLVLENRWDEAAQEVALELCKRPSDPKLHGLQGWCLYQQGRYEEAARAFERATLIDIHYWEAGRMHAECLDRLRRYDEAIQVAERWLRVQPNDRRLRMLAESLGRHHEDKLGGWTKTRDLPEVVDARLASDLY
jgi:Flp pilus assembly protein TadD